VPTVSESKPALGTPARMTILALLAFLVFAGFGAYVLLFFVPIAGWYIWKAHDRIAELERKLADRSQGKSGKPGK
jgi:hypothetical protein